MKHTLLFLVAIALLGGCSSSKTPGVEDNEFNNSDILLESNISEGNQSTINIEILDEKYIDAGSVDENKSPRSYLPIKFKFNESKIDDSQKAKMFYNVDLASCDMASRLTVIGYADGTGSSRYNYDLGLRRASSVSEALVKAGVDASKITIKSGGDKFLTCDTGLSACNKKNRIVTISETIK